MKDFGKTILNRLLDKYENSVLSKGGSERKLSISLSLKDKELATYCAVDSYDYRSRNDSVLAEYEKNGFIVVKRDKFCDFESLTLKIDRVDEIYHFLNRANPGKELEKVGQILSDEEEIGLVGKYIESCRDWIEKKHSFPKSFNSCEQLKDILLGIKEIENLDKETKFRDFSVKVYGDSKKFEKLKSRIARIFYDFDEECLVDNFDDETVLEILSEKNLVRNTTYAIIKGDVTFKLSSVIINLSQLGYEYCLSDEMINDLMFIKTGAKKVITVENLTTFYDFSEEKYIVLYLGGFHNHTKRTLIKKLHDSYPELLFFHFGDIDAGGIHILKHLRSKTGVAFLPYKMDVDTLLSNKERWKKLTDNDIKRLKKLDDEEFLGLINFMLSNNCKLEQEAIEQK